jgi:hypothetical protein
LLWKHLNDDNLPQYSENSLFFQGTFLLLVASELSPTGTGVDDSDHFVPEFVG